LLYPLGQSLGFILLAMGVGRKLAEFKVSTVSQIFEVVYKSKLLKKVASVFSIVSLFMIFVAQIIASNKFMGSLGVESYGWFIAFWAIVILYTAVGGMKAVVATDIIQASFFVGAFVLCFGYIVYTSDFSVGQMLSMSSANDDFDLTTSKLSGWLLMPLLFMAIEQDMAQRCFAGATSSIVSRAALWAGIGTFVVCLIPVFFGVMAKNIGLEIPEGASVFMTLIQTKGTPILTALVGCAIIAAIISTADSLINAISSNLSQDFDISFLKNVRFSQILTVVIAVLGIFVSFSFNNVVDVMIVSYELSVSCLFVPIIMAIYRRQGVTLSATLAIVGGALGFFIFRLYPTPIPKEIASVMLSFLGFFVGEALGRSKIQQETAEESL